MIKLIGGWDFSRKLENFDKDVIIVCDYIINSLPQGKKIFLQCEPSVIVGDSVEKYLLNNFHLYDFILTWNQKILDNCSNAIFYPFGSTWISNDFEIKEKIFKLSFLRGQKDFATGHRIRHQIFKLQQNIKNIPIDFRDQVSSGDVRNNFLFSDSQFTLVVENCSQKNYFTEKLMDALITKTVPIYFGCPNINDFFNKKGILTFNNVEEFFNIINNLNDKTYQDMVDSVEDNYLLSRKFEEKDWYVRLNNKIKSLI